MSDNIVQHSKGMAKAFQCDVTNEEEVSKAVKDSVETFFNRIKPETSNMLDGLFSNAGTAGIGWIHETTIEDWEFVLKVNLTNDAVSNLTYSHLDSKSFGIMFQYC